MIPHHFLDGMNFNASLRGNAPKQCLRQNTRWIRHVLWRRSNLNIVIPAQAGIYRSPTKAFGDDRKTLFRNDKRLKGGGG